MTRTMRHLTSMEVRAIIIPAKLVDSHLYCRASMNSANTANPDFSPSSEAKLFCGQRGIGEKLGLRYFGYSVTEDRLQMA